MKKTKGKKGFTLIEMLVVVGIIGIMATMLVISVGRVRKNSIDTRRKANLENIRGAITFYYSAKSTWPTIAATNAWSGLITTLSNEGYISDNVPADEDSDGKNDYSVCQCGAANCTCDTGSQVKLLTRLEVSSNDGCSANSTCSDDIKVDSSSVCCALEMK